MYNLWVWSLILIIILCVFTNIKTQHSKVLALRLERYQHAIVCSFQLYWHLILLKEKLS